MEKSELSFDEVLLQLSKETGEFPTEAVVAADSYQEELTPAVLKAIKDGISQGLNASDDLAAFFAVAVYLVAKWREKKAYPLIVSWFSMPEEGPFDIGGDIILETGPRILASVFDGDPSAIKKLIEKAGADEYGRGGGLEALAILVMWNEWPHDAFVEYAKELIGGKIEPQAVMVWNTLGSIVASGAYPELVDPFLAIYDKVDVDPQYVGRAEVEAGRTQTSDSFQISSLRISDVVAEMAWAFEGNEEEEDEEFSEVVAPVVRQEPKIGRNDKCPCGSGKKYKKCCGRNAG